MQKREFNKSGGSYGGASAPPAKRGRPFGSGNSSAEAAAAAAAAAADHTAAPSNLLGPSLLVHNAFTVENNKRIVHALQSGLKNELTWALNTLTLLSFKEKDDNRKDSNNALTRISGLLDALLTVIDDWRDIALPKEHVRAPRVRNLGVNLLVTGFGNEYEMLGSNSSVPHSGLGSGAQDASMLSNVSNLRSSEWWLEEDGLFNLDDEGRAERQQCAVAASNIIRNFSFMQDNETIMAFHRHCLETIFQCIEDYITEDEELVTNALETIVNLSPMLDLQVFGSSKASYIKMTAKRAVQAIVGVLESPVKAWHCSAAELLGRLVINPENEPFLLPFIPQIHKRLVDLMSLPAFDAQAAAVGALYNFSEVNMDCRLTLANERWAIDRLLKVIKGPHPISDICKKAAMILESLVSEPQNRGMLLAYENAFAEVLFSDTRCSEIFARILYELTSRPNNKVAAARGIWGM